MKTFKQYFNEEMSTNIAAGWITPKGKVVRVPMHQHDDFVRDNLSSFNITPKELTQETMPKQVAINKGAIRFHLFKPGMTYKPTATIGTTLKAFNKFKGKVEDLLVNNRIKDYDLYITNDDGSFKGHKSMSLYENNEQHKTNEKL